ncbi:VanZ family protein [Pantanalinema rosaneae CENA516]|uniref:VanZ family protein n=1 Tax=Pantanalinema rosaneae TaxID=1620701 RepID=UPI003D6F05BD
MNLSPHHAPPRVSADQLATRWANRIIVLSVVLILVATLYPFRLRIPDVLLIRQVIRQFVFNPTDKVDLIANVLLFVPLGFGVSAKLLPHKWLSRSTWLIVLGCGAGLSLMVECLQVLLSDRTSALTDVMTNTLGGYLGYLTFKYARSPLLDWIQLGLEQFQRLVSRLSFRQIAAASVIYAVLAIGVVGWLNGSTLRTWDLNARLFIGTDPAHRFSWEGTIGNVQICDRALSASALTPFLTQAESMLPCGDHLVAHYPLTNTSGLTDSLGRSPDLVWRGNQTASATLSSQGAAISAQHWLEMTDPATVLNQRLRASSELTVAANITVPQTDLPNRFNQIMSLTNHSFLGNFSLIQLRSNLLLWIATNFHSSLRPPPQGFKANVLADDQPHRMVMTYSGLALRGYVDQAENPLLVLLTPVDYQVICSLLAFVPMGILLRLLVNGAKGQPLVRLLLTGVGCVIPPLVLESWLADQSDRPIRLANLLLSILIVSATFWLSRGLATQKSIRSEIRASESEHP